ncbi:ATPase family AAA domain-containing protein 2-like [Anas acuta]|uniref:ATPase family AAA domain-containing protein 2-like n=1 Tax=Anas acuta TaxID=28680 RepID=UPI0035C89DDF
MSGPGYKYNWSKLNIVLAIIIFNQSPNLNVCGSYYTCAHHLNPILQDDMFDSDDDASLLSGDELKDGMPDGPEKKRLCFSRSAFCEPTSCRPRLLIVGKEGYGQVSYVAPAVLHALEKFPVHTLDLSVLLTNIAPPEEICGQVPDYATRIKDPMDLSTVLTQIDSCQYPAAGDYLKDIDLICNNALEYYPDQRSTSEDVLFSPSLKNLSNV